jgi:hypothetical protein
MKTVLTIFLVFILPVSGVQVSLDRHYCGGNLTDVRISVTGKMASCGMEQTETGCTAYQVINTKCCDDQVVFYSITSKYFPVYFQLAHPTWIKNLPPVQVNTPRATDQYNLSLFPQVFPPGSYSCTGLSQPYICVFRI